MENNQRLIDAKDFDLRVSQKKMSEVFPNWNELPNEVQDAVCKHAQHLHMLLETQPTIDAVEVVHGRWVQCEDWDLDYECSVCGCYACENKYEDYNVLTPYCPNCGAKMDGERKDNDR